MIKEYPDYEATIGIEVHVQLKTKTKMFCPCQNKFGSIPNSNICPICAGHPGTLPILNRKAVDLAIKTGLATNCKIEKLSRFARKHYMYPDLPKNFQITQDDEPICTEGLVTINLPDGSEKKIRLIRIHMEEDAGKNIHGTNDVSYVDLNRAGTPLLEIVSYPDITSSIEAKIYLGRIKSIVQYLGVSDANMEEGSFRADTNISVKKKSASQLGTRVELKNINSFKFIGQAIEYEIKRQIEQLNAGTPIDQETRSWDTKKQISVPMRKKEEAHDYRYLNEPDIPPLLVSKEQIEKHKSNLPELPNAKFNRLQKDYSLTPYEAEILADQRDLAIFFEETTKICNEPKMVSNWILRDVLGMLKEHKINLTECKVTPSILAELIKVIKQNIITTKAAQEVFIEMFKTGKYPSIIIQEKNLQQIDSLEELEAIILKIINDNPEMVKKYRSGKDKLFMFFVGQAMKETKGKGSPKIIHSLLKKHL